MKVIEKSQKPIDKPKKSCYNCRNFIKAVTRTRAFAFFGFQRPAGWCEAGAAVIAYHLRAAGPSLFGSGLDGVSAV